MKRILSVLTDLKFGLKVGGGFFAVLLLTAVVGGVGFLAIHNLSSRFVVADQASKVAAQVQATSLLREDYLNNPSSDLAASVQDSIAKLEAELGVLSGELSGDAAAEEQVTGAGAAISEFGETFAQVVDQTRQQSERLATLQKSTEDLEALSAKISGAVDAEEKTISAEARSANERLDDTNELQRSVFELKDEVVAVNMLYLKGNGNLEGESLTRAIDYASHLAEVATKLASTKIEGIDHETVGNLAAQSNTLHEVLVNLTKDLGFSEAYEARLAVGKAIEGMDAVTQAVLAQVNPVVSKAKPDAQTAATRLATVRTIARDATMLNERALSARAETLYLFGAFGATSPESVEQQIAGLAELETDMAKTRRSCRPPRMLSTRSPFRSPASTSRSRKCCPPRRTCSPNANSSTA
ncbi:MAG: hypothetical protein Tsb0019_11540 [Roseibium sp.]